MANPDAHDVEQDACARKDNRIRQIAWGGLAAFSALCLIWMVWGGIRGREYVNCNARQANIMIQYLREASLAASEEREAHDRLRRAQYVGDRAAEHAAIEHYFEVRRLADQRRAQTPLPPLPEQVCGEPKP